MPRRNHQNRPKKIDNFDFEELPICKTGIESLKIKSFTYKNEAQRICCEIVDEHILTFIEGPAGSAKSFLCVALMLEALVDGRVKKGYISRPNVDSGPPIGHLPGTLEEKMAPWIRPIVDTVDYFIGRQKREQLFKEGIIEIVPFAVMQGRTLENAFIIIDEAQDAKPKELRMALTRIGEKSICGVAFDPKQSNISSNCLQYIQKFKNIKSNRIGYFQFTINDVVRSPVVKEVLEIWGED